MSDPETSLTRYVICIRCDGYEASLERRKVYTVLDDRDAHARGMLRVVDESGEDYLYPAEFFVPITLPDSAERAVRRVGVMER